MSSPFDVPENVPPKETPRPSRLQDAPELAGRPLPPRIVPQDSPKEESKKPKLQKYSTGEEAPREAEARQEQPEKPSEGPGRPSSSSGGPGRPGKPKAPVQRAEPSSPTPGLNEDHKYVLAGALTSQQVIAAESDLLAHLESKIMELVGRVQQELINQGLSDSIVAARYNPELRQTLATDIDRLTLSYLMQEGRTRTEDKPLLIAAVINEILGLGPLQPLWQDSSITEVIVNGPSDVYVEQEGKLVPVKGVKFRSPEHLIEVCQRILAPLNRKLDVKDPLADGRLPDGSRVNVVHPAIAPHGPLLTIRRFPEANRSFADLVEIGSMSHDMACTVAWLVRSRASTLVVGATGTGKLLPLDTPIPTPAGWTTMGKLKVGETVFGRDGKPCQVTFLSDINPTPDLYRITFSDGQTVVADADHQWVVASGIGKQSFSSCSESVMTTAAILEARRDRAVSFGVRVTEPVHFPEKELPIPPYAFGFMIRGYDALASSGEGSSFPMLVEKMLSEMKSTGRLGDYAESALWQRLALVRGFLSAQEVKSEGGKIVCTISRRNLAEEMARVLRSLGLIVKTSLAEDQASTLTIHSSQLLTAGYWDTYWAWEGTSPYLDIVNIEQVESVPGRCIQVDSEDSTYLVQDFLPTHNTTLLNALSAAIPRDERVVTIEDSLELRLHPDSHVAAMEARPNDASGQNAVPIKNLVKNALRMRPDRIIVGEVRGAEALNMLEACNTGHEGSMSTVHANGPDEALSRLSVMIAQGGEMPPDKVDWLVASALDLIVQVRRYKDGSRRVSGVYEVPNLHDLPTGSALRTVPLWEWRRTGEDEKGRVTGEYVKINDLSENLREKLGLDFEPPMTWEDILELSDAVPEEKPDKG